MWRVKRNKAGHDRPGQYSAPFADDEVLPQSLRGFAISITSAPNPLATCVELAADYAHLGKSLSRFFDDLDLVCRVLNLGTPSVRQIKSASVAWSDAFSEKLAAAQCYDPLNGLDTEHHLRARMAEVYLEPERIGRTVLVRLDTSAAPVTGIAEPDIVSVFAREMYHAFICSEFRAAVDADAISAFAITDRGMFVLAEAADQAGTADLASQLRNCASSLGLRSAQLGVADDLCHAYRLIDPPRPPSPAPP
jgi:hypothetical protein